MWENLHLVLCPSTSWKGSQWRETSFVNYVEKLLCGQVLYKHMNKFILTLMPVSASYVGKSLLIMVFSLAFEGSWCRKPYVCKLCRKVFVTHSSLQAMKEFTVETNLMYVSCVINPPLKPFPFNITEGFTMGRNSVCVRWVGKPSLVTVLFNERLTVERKPTKERYVRKTS